MSVLLLSCAEVREREARAIEQLGMPSLVLMENAGRNSAELLLQLGVAGRVTILCGKGNNGGDGLVIARHLDNARLPVQVFLFARPAELSPDAAVNHRILAGSGVPLEVLPGPALDPERFRAELSASEWVVDALFGTGLKGPVRAPFDTLIGLVNTSSARVLAVDVPSGLDGDTGQPLGPTVRAHHTATMLAWKKGFVTEAAREWVGQVHLIDIGLPRRCLA